MNGMFWGTMSLLAVDPIFGGAVELMTRACTLGGGAVTGWGVVLLGGALKDKNGVSMDTGIWQIIAGVIIIAGGQLFGNLVGTP